MKSARHIHSSPKKDKNKFVDDDEKMLYNKFYKDTFCIEIIQPSGQKIVMTGCINENHALQQTEAYRPEGSTWTIRKTSLKDFFNEQRSRYKH